MMMMMVAMIIKVFKYFVYKIIKKQVYLPVQLTVLNVVFSRRLGRIIQHDN